MEGIRRELVLGLVLIVGTAIEQAPSVDPLHSIASQRMFINCIKAEFLRPNPKS